MNFEAEKKRIQKMNRSELNSYEAQNKRLLEKARDQVKKTKAERSDKRENSLSGKLDNSIRNSIEAMIEEARLKELNSEIQKRKLNFLTPQERRAREEKRKSLILRLEALK